MEKNNTTMKKNEFKRDFSWTKKKNTKSFFTGNGKEMDRTSTSENEPDNQRVNYKGTKNKEKSIKELNIPWYKRYEGVLWGALGTGLAIGLALGGVGYAAINPSDEELVEKINYYKEEVFQINSSFDDIERELYNRTQNEEALSEELQIKTEEINKLKSKIVELEKELQVSKQDSKVTISGKSETNKNTPETNTIPMHDTKTFFNDSLYISITDISATNTTDLQIGATGFENLIRTDAKAGTQFYYQGKSKYQIRVIKVNYITDEVEIQVTKL
jgi:hypothetical protein